MDAEIEDAETHEGAQTSGNKDAERALLRLKQKLQGIEYGETLSVEGQVHTLIHEARDPERLCKMYPGYARRREERRGGEGRSAINSQSLFFSSFSSFSFFFRWAAWV